MKRTRIDRSKAVVVRAAEKQGIDFKPDGFWYSADGDWERWCKSEEPGWLKERHIHDVLLGNERMLCIRNVNDFDAFHDEYRSGDAYCEKVDWSRVAWKYDGIEIAPYLWERRHGSLWYYVWDCASGCIWRPCGVTVELMSETLTKR